MMAPHLEFRRLAESCGLVLQDLRDDNKVHAVKTVDKPRHKNGRYQFDGETGWVQNWATMLSPAIFRPERKERDYTQARNHRPAARRVREEQDAARKAADVAEGILTRVRYGTHPYLIRKGFPDRMGMIDTAMTVFDGERGPYKVNTIDALVVPMRNVVTDRLQSVQWIDPAGEKLFLKGGQAKAAVYTLGARSWNDVVLVEGLATGLSVQAALQRIYRRARVLVCFSAGNLVTVAQLVPPRGLRLVVADHDKLNPQTGKRAGHAAAEQTGLPFVVPPAEGDDFNDVHQRDGLEAAVQLLQEGLART